MDGDVFAIHERIKQELQYYIRSQYFGKSPLLLNAFEKEFEKKGVLYQTPYLESPALYKKAEGGLSSLHAAAWVKEFFIQLAQNDLGVYPTPYEHQIQALQAFLDGKDILVSTGTGSGKTECFMWPLLAKLAVEAHDQPENWKIRGVRTIIMYPMNALVNDQVSRLRKLIGDHEGRFLNIFNQFVSDSRRPQFGMYTGRTPYPGTQGKEQDKMLAEQLRKLISDEQDKDYLQVLRNSGRIPAKADLQGFISGLENGRHATNAMDAELITRFEMLKACPDILITNYSMLEYMLMRPREQPIWNSTRSWLDSGNRLLFVIDEAHMYHGSAGGEVALLIRRLMHKLGISREQVQFILTTASMPHETTEDEQAVRKFAVDLTSAQSDNFVFLMGQTTSLPDATGTHIPAAALCSFVPTENEADLFEALKQFWSTCGIDSSCTDLHTLQNWMYDHCAVYEPFRSLLEMCRGTAVSLDELGKQLFPNLNSVDQQTPLRNLLLIAAQAQNADGAYLFPAKLHMLFRGLSGVYACTNQQCPHSHSSNGLRLGQIFHQSGVLQCPECGGAVYELINDRRCGALFLKGFIVGEPGGENKYLWPDSDRLLNKDLHEIHLYLPQDGENFKRDKNANAPRPCYLNTQSGYLSFDDSWADECNGVVKKLYYSAHTEKGRLDLYEFTECPHCRGRLGRRELTPFRTRGNQSFYNLVKAQFNLEPPVARFKDIPNQGRKVLLFSDSRQRAAKLALDMSNASDAQAVMQLYALAVLEMEKRQGKNKTLNDLYGYFVLAAGKKNVQLFHDEYAGEEQHENGSRSTFSKHCRLVLKRAARAVQRNERDIFEPDKTFVQDACDMAKEHLLRLYCSGYNNLYDTTVGWLEPCDSDDVDEFIEENNISREQFLELFNAWVMEICRKKGALGNCIKEELRDKALIRYGSFGLEDCWNLSENILNALGTEINSTDLRNMLQETFLEKNSDENRYYLKLNNLKPCLSFDKNGQRTHKWHLCERCSKVTPYSLAGCCPSCGGKVHVMTEEEYKALQFWLQPIEETIRGAAIHVINTEEHTAQLSYKDQRDKLWSKTESYEMRFQNILKKGKEGQNLEYPVDILSCTTTMEVGIDIGSLVAIGLRNIPPMRENYQQRAGRAGRRGTQLSTVVTFCEDGPHDSFYFSNPAPMLSGTCRRPWIDPNNEKLLNRHLNLVALEGFLSDYSQARGLDAVLVSDFFETSCYQAWNKYLCNFSFPKDTILITAIPGGWKENLKQKMDGVLKTFEKHPELFTGNSKKTMLDALYEEGIIPTFSFPKDVVHLYITDAKGQIQHEVDRGLDIAISEYAPGRALVVDKNTYEIGGFYYLGAEKRKAPAKEFLDDQSFLKEIYLCPECGWFGVSDDLEESKVCPFCGKALNGEEHVRHMLRPWGFAPKNGKASLQAHVDETYSYAEQPLYSTVPDSGLMKPVAGSEYMSVALLPDQSVIMLNKGPSEKGFLVCEECGAALPGDDSKMFKDKKIETPYWNMQPKHGIKQKCSHGSVKHVFLGYSFVTDMLVLSIKLDDSVFVWDRSNVQWLRSAAISLSEAIRLQASRLLDVEFTELKSGARIRLAAKSVDIYLYDNLSSGAGYSSELDNRIEKLLDLTEHFLCSCPSQCDTACQDCLKHYYNQNYHHLLNRDFALELLRFARRGELPKAVNYDYQCRLLEPLASILRSANIETKFLEKQKQIRISNSDTQQQKILLVHPSLWIREKTANSDSIDFTEYQLKYSRPDVASTIKQSL